MEIKKILEPPQKESKQEILSENNQSLLQAQKTKKELLIFTILFFIAWISIGVIRLVGVPFLEDMLKFGIFVIAVLLAITIKKLL